MLGPRRGSQLGDAAQNEGGIVLHPVTEPRVEIDLAGARLRASASTTFTQLLARTVPLGLLPPVLPGTRHLTIGGAVAADVHGKNQHADGSISDWIEEIDLLAGDGSVRSVLPCSRAFRATVGGMGLTGVILAVRLRLLRIHSARLQVTSRRFPDLDALLAAQDHPCSRYAVAWLDLSATGGSLGRGVLDTADHLAEPDPRSESGGLSYRPGHPLPAPGLTVCPVTPWTARAFNAAWYRASPEGRTAVAASPAISTGSTPCGTGTARSAAMASCSTSSTVPPGEEKVIGHAIELLQRSGAAAFLGTLKRFGPASGNYLSFPGLGWSLAVECRPGRPGLRTVCLTTWTAW